jgi:hypothetical protein
LVASCINEKNFTNSNPAVNAVFLSFGGAKAAGSAWWDDLLLGLVFFDQDR